jgi:hypothetical protein
MMSPPTCKVRTTFQPLSRQRFGGCFPTLGVHASARPLKLMASTSAGGLGKRSMLTLL